MKTTSSKEPDVRKCHSALVGVLLLIDCMQASNVEYTATTKNDDVKFTSDVSVDVWRQQRAAARTTCDRAMNVPG
jgi:hypothetical protein